MWVEMEVGLVIFVVGVDEDLVVFVGFYLFVFELGLGVEDIVCVVLVG